MFCGVRTRFVVVVLLCCSSTAYAKSTKKSKDESAVLTKKLINKAKPSPPAIIAIEIVDPNENKTKNYKRTIDSALGYGYQPQPRYQVYKYSQHDIPPYRGSYDSFSGGIKTHHYDIQKSVSYKLPNPNLNRYYQPGTTLYSTINNQGQIGGLSSHLPQQPYVNEPQVPVIILRVYPSQLNDPSAVLHPNLPQSHPLASAVNSIDVQSLLAKYVQNYLVEQQQQQYYPDYQQQYQQPQYQYQMPYDYPQDDGLLTHENYPRETHTRVIFRTDKNKLGSGTAPPKEVKTIQITLPSEAYSSVQVETPEMQYGYSSQDQGYYYQQGGDAQQYYYQTAPEPEQPAQTATPYNYHAHQKRSKKTKFSRTRFQDGIKLDPIKA